MRSRRRPKSSPDRVDPLHARVADLELRVRALETKLRQVSAKLKAEPKASLEEQAAAAKGTRRTRSRPRCPGCSLELPQGRRKETCVWCGFRFDAVGL